MTALIGKYVLNLLIIAVSLFYLIVILINIILLNRDLRGDIAFYNNHKWVIPCY